MGALMMIEGPQMAAEMNPYRTCKVVEAHGEGSKKLSKGRRLNVHFLTAKPNGHFCTFYETGGSCYGL